MIDLLIPMLLVGTVIYLKLNIDRVNRIVQVVENLDGEASISFNGTKVKNVYHNGKLIWELIYETTN